MSENDVSRGSAGGSPFPGDEFPVRERIPAVPPEMNSGLLAKYSFLNFLGMAVPALTGLVTLPVVIRWLGTERMGVFFWIMVVMGYFGLFELNLSRAMVKYVSEALGRKEFARIPKIFWSIVAFQGVSGLIGGVALVLLAPTLVARFLKMPPALLPEATAALAWMGVALPVNIILPSFRGVLEAAHRFDLVNLIKIPTNSAVFIIPLIGAVLQMDLKGIIILFVITRVVSLAFWAAAGGRTFPGLFRLGFLSRSDLRRVYAFGGWNMLFSMLWPVLSSFDRIFIGAQLGAKSVGFYAPASEGINKLGLIPGSLQLALFPAFSLLAANPVATKAKDLFAKAVKYTILTMGPLVVLIIVFARWILQTWLGGEYAQTSTLVLQILAGSYLLQALASVPFSFLQGLGRADVTSVVLMIETAVIIPVFVLFIKFWGIAGAAAAVGFRSGLEVTLLVSSSRKRGGFDKASVAKENIVRLLLALSALAVWSLVWGRMINGLPGFLAVGAAVAAFAVFAWARVLDEEERSRLRHFVLRTKG